MRARRSTRRQPLPSGFNRRVFVGISAAATLAASARGLRAGAARAIASAARRGERSGDYRSSTSSSNAPTRSIPGVCGVAGLGRPGHAFSRRGHAHLGCRYLDPRRRAAFRQGGLCRNCSRPLRALRRSERRRRDGLTRSFALTRKRLDRNDYAGDIRAAALWLSAKFPGTKIGITGFCMGGHIALIAAIDDGESLLGRRTVLRRRRRRRPQGDSRFRSAAVTAGAIPAFRPTSVRAFAAALTRTERRPQSTTKPDMPSSTISALRTLPRPRPMRGNVRSRASRSICGGVTR